MELGLYEQVVNELLAKQLTELPANINPSVADIDKAEASTILAAYIAQQAESMLAQASDKGLDTQVALANKMLSVIEESPEHAINTPARQLLSLVSTTQDKAKRKKSYIVRPETSISHSSLFTGSQHEPQLETELNKEIASADRIDMLVSFIKWSGLRLLMPRLQAFAGRGGRLRIITTTYIGATDAKAIEELSKLPNTRIKVSFDSQHTRLHAKAYLFYRNTGFSTAYVGSSNISMPAITSGLEWNMKITAQDQPTVMDKMAATFASYWESSDFEEYTSQMRNRLVEAIEEERNPKHLHVEMDAITHFLDVRPYPYQQDILDKLRAEREVANRWHNLVVAATGTGKTVISALDYRSWCRLYSKGRNAKLLFVAHREEILKQSLSCFRMVLKDNNFGELLVGSSRVDSFDHLFCSIQSLNSRKLTETLPANQYDYIVVDEFHHAAAPSYRRLLSYFKPKTLLGLTATPERLDGESILPWFDNRIAAEIRLPEAIDRKLLCPFHYFGVSDEVDLSTVRWTRGGYDTKELENVFVFKREIALKRVRMVIDAVVKYTADVNDMCGLGFCVSKEHARFMAEQFNAAGIPAIALTSDDSHEARIAARGRLESGEVKIIFVVDLYNEGVDIPQVKTVLFLRPTDSLTIFIQQLGRGLRLSPETGKECLTVLDFIGQANKLYRFEEKFAALLPDKTGSVCHAIDNDFAFLPKGCYIQLERKAKEYVLGNIRQSLGMKSGIVSRLRTFEEDTGKEPTLANFLNYYHLDIRTILAKNSFSRLCVEAGVREDFGDPDEKELTKALSRVCQIDSRRWIRFILGVLLLEDVRDEDEMSAGERRMLKMFQITLWPNSFKDNSFDLYDKWVERLMDNPTMLAEIIGTLQWQLDHIDFVDAPVDWGFDCPLDLHCSYSRDQIFAAIDLANPSSVREGVRWIPDHSVDVLVNTLNKAEKDYSPTTMYQDYSISDRLFHWQSQSTTSEASPTGQRYIHHVQQGSNVALFVREYKKDSFGLTAPFCFLGLVDYRSHEGERPMSIVWSLREPIPARYLPKTNKLAG
ncbi:MAG: DUF3427 domain-containing protein [Atopobiaceae bacterium]|nr:DUF3427 domain-containing protein [Atopobiaceae bacterium]